MTAPVPASTATPQPPRTAHPRSPVSPVGRSTPGPDAAAEVELLVEEIRHLRARLESLETVLAHAVIPTVARVAAVPPPDADADADAPTRVPSTPNPGDRTAVTTTVSRARLNRRPRLFPLPDARPSRPRPPLPG